MKLNLVLCDVSEEHCKTWEPIFERLQFDDLKIQVICKPFYELDVGSCDALATMGNSFGLTESTLLGNYFGSDTLNECVQQHIRNEWMGFQPMGTCSIIDMSQCQKDVHKLLYSVLYPYPRMIKSKDAIYKSMWAILCTIRRHNWKCPQSKIETLLLTGLPTKCIQPSASGYQMALACKHFFHRLHKDFRLTSWEDVEGFKVVLNQSPRQQLYSSPQLQHQSQTLQQSQSSHYPPQFHHQSQSFQQSQLASVPSLQCQNQSPDFHRNDYQMKVVDHSISSHSTAVEAETVSDCTTLTVPH